MITKEQAIDDNNNEFHFGDCTNRIGPKGGIRIRIEKWRRNGKTKVWKTNDNFRIPIKYGMYNYSEITQRNANDFHLAADCPLNE